MADFDSSTEAESGLLQLAICAGQPQRKDRELFVERGWEQDKQTLHWSSNESRTSDEDTRRHTSGVSVISGKSSSNVTRHSSVTSITGDRTSLDGTPVNNTPLLPPPSPKETDAELYMASVNDVGLNTLDDLPTAETKMQMHASDQSASTADASEPHRASSLSSSSSPRSHIRWTREKYSQQSPALHLGPMERFLAQDESIELDPARMAEDRTKMRSLRIDVFRLRAKIRAKRAELNEKESAKNSADEAFMKFVRERASLLSSPATASLNLPVSDIQEYYAAMQAARDDYGPSEYEYNNLEELMDQTEFELDSMEGRLYKSTISHPGGVDTALIPTSKTPPPASQSFLGLSSEAREDFHPLHAKYLSRLGDLDLATESYDNTFQERQSLLSKQETRTRLGLIFDEDAKRFLESLPAREAALRDEITEIRKDLEILKAQCLEEGIDVEDSSLGSLEDSGREGGSSNNDITEETTVREIGERRSEHDHSMFPKLFPTSVEDRAKLEFLITEFDENNKSDRINRWLLYKLQTSPLEIDLLARIFLKLVNILDFRQWEEKVLYFWGRDTANKPPGAFIATQTGSASAPASTKQHSPPNTKSIRPSPDFPYRPTVSHKAKSAPASVDLGRTKLEIS